MGNQRKRPTVDDFHARLGEDKRAIFEAVREVVTAVEPDVEERLAWAGVGYKHAGNYLCVVYVGRDGANVMLMRGAELHDAHGHLDGRGHATRNFRVSSVDRFDRAALAGLLRQQAALYAAGARGGRSANAPVSNMAALAVANVAS